jgi:hypothetical protein
MPGGPAQYGITAPTVDMDISGRCKDNTAAVQHYIDQNCKFLVYDDKLDMEREYAKFIKNIEKKLQLQSSNVVAHH